MIAVGKILQVQLYKICHTCSFLNTITEIRLFYHITISRFSPTFDRIKECRPFSRCNELMKIQFDVTPEVLGFLLYKDWQHKVQKIFKIILYFSGSHKWRSDNRCGTQYPLSDGSKAECDPLGEYPCCSPHAWCGHTYLHCSCHNGCIDYRTKPIGMSLLTN